MSDESKTKLYRGFLKSIVRRDLVHVGPELDEKLDELIVSLKSDGVETNREEIATEIAGCGYELLNEFVLRNMNTGSVGFRNPK